MWANSLGWAVDSGLPMVMVGCSGRASPECFRVLFSTEILEHGSGRRAVTCSPGKEIEIPLVKDGEEREGWRLGDR